MSRRAVRRALVSVSDKTGLVELGTALAGAGVELVSTGSTAAALAAAGVPVTPVERVTGFPECLDGRVKTLHPAVHAGILADPGRPDHRRTLDELGITPFELVVVNLYPFQATVAAGAPPAEVVEQIDIGGPTLIRAAAKNHAAVAVVVEPAGYRAAAAAVAAGGFTGEERRALAAAAFAHTAGYDRAVADWFAAGGAGTAGGAGADGAGDGGWPPVVGVALELVGPLRYGENPHQRAALYREPAGPPGPATARQLHGKAMSWTNFVDAEAAWRAAGDFARPAVAVVKHATPCGVAVADDIAEAHRRAHACDPVSAYGGVVASNRPVSAAMAATLVEVFTEVVVAPGFEPAALETLTRRAALRLLECPVRLAGPAAEWRWLTGGALRQDSDRIDAPGDEPAGWQRRSGGEPDPATLADLEFAWRACRSARSNAVLLARDGATVGIGMGQVNRVDAARLAVARAGDRAAGAVAASDAFFPFPDGLQVLADAGVRAVVAPGGSIRDDDVVAAANAAGITLLLAGARHFLH